MDNLKNVTTFENFLKEKFSMKSVKDFLIKPKPSKPEPIPYNPGEEQVDVNEPFNLYLYRTKDLTRHDEFTMVRVIDCDVKDYKIANNTYYDFILKVLENERDCIIRFDILDKKLYYFRPAAVNITFNATTNKKGAEIIYSLLKEKINELREEKLDYVKITDIPLVKA